LDRHELWRRVRYDWERANERRAQGHVPVVQVWVAGRPDPIELGFVTTRRGPDEPWVRFETPASADESTGAIPPGVSWLHVHESAILAVEVLYRRASHGIGFTHRIESDEPEELAA
jgi:hypothetical protein